MGLAVAQQFYSGAWRSRASDDRVTRSPNECNVEDRHDLIAAVRRRGRNGKCGCHRESVGSCISNARCRWRNRCRGGCGSGFNWRLPFAREARDKCRTTCCSKREKRDGYSAYRYGGHGRQPVAKSLARQHPPEINGAPNRSRQSSPRTRIHAACEATPRNFGDFGGDAPGLVAGEEMCRRAPSRLLLEVRRRLPSQMSQMMSGATAPPGARARLSKGARIYAMQ